MKKLSTVYYGKERAMENNKVKVKNSFLMMSGTKKGKSSDQV